MNFDRNIYKISKIYKILYIYIYKNLYLFVTNQIIFYCYGEKMVFFKNKIFKFKLILLY